MKNLKKTVSILLTASMGASMVCGCSKDKSDKEKTDEPKASAMEIVEGGFDYSKYENVSYEPEKVDQAYLQFVMNLYSKCTSAGEGENVMVSPASVMMALSVAAAGADGETFEQMVNTMAPGIDPDEFMKFASDYNKYLNEAEGIDLSCANSLWLNQAFCSQVFGSYLEYVKDKFNANATALDFEDGESVEIINDWINENTNGMIKKAINDLEPSNIMVIVNAIAFEAAWMDAYEEYQVEEGKFTTADGGTVDVSMLNSVEDYYFENDIATGFMKPYEGGRYAFVGILPKDETLSIEEFSNLLTAEQYMAFWESGTYEFDVITSMPKFESKYEITLNDVLKSMGMEDAFDMDNADFTKIISSEDYNAYISKVIHKTYIDVNENGTRAAAVTVVTLDAAAAMEEPEYKYVNLDRPYVYAIVDTESGTPLFIGNVTDPTAE